MEAVDNLKKKGQAPITFHQGVSLAKKLKCVKYMECSSKAPEGKSIRPLENQLSVFRVPSSFAKIAVGRSGLFLPFGVVQEKSVFNKNCSPAKCADFFVKATFCFGHSIMEKMGVKDFLTKIGYRSGKQWPKATSSPQELEVSATGGRANF